MRSRTAIALWTAIVVLLAGNVAALRAIDATGHPSRWDPRIASLVDFVEDARDLRFDHPVTVEFLAEDEYQQRVTTEEGDLSEEEQQDLKVFEGQARALGLISSDTNLLDDLNTISSTGTLAYYDPAAEKMVIRGTALTVGSEVTVVHELTHALQDQAFDLEREFATDGADSFFQALAEGDATRIENEYVESLDDAEQEEYFEEQDSDIDSAQDALGDVAPALVQFFGAPYALGEQVTTLIVAEQKVKKLDALFRRPPDSDEGLINVFAALDDDRAKKVETPKLRSGEEKDDAGDFGSVAWFVVLASFVDERVALNAVDGWGGDAYVGYTKGDRNCIRIAFRGDTPNDNAEMTAALNQWKAAFTENTAQVAASATGVELDACEPKVVPKPRPEAENALALPTVRLALLSELLSGGASRSVAQCVTRQFVAQVRLDTLDGETDADQKALFDLVTRIGRACATGQLS